MNSLSFAIKRFQISIFCTLTVLLSYASYFLPVPREALPFVFVLVPPVVALLLTYATEGGAGVRALLGQSTRWRVGLKWVVGAVLLGLVIRLAVGVIAQLMGLLPAVPLQPENWMQALVLGLVYLVAAVLEELGWRGYALTRLLTQRSPLFAAMALGLPWGIVHIALHLPGMWAEGLPWLPTVLQLVALSLIITWLFVRSGYSLPVVILFHAAQSAFGFFNAGLAPLHVTWLMTAVWGVVAGLVLIDMVVSFRLQKQPLPALSEPACCLQPSRCCLRRSGPRPLV